MPFWTLRRKFAAAGVMVLLLAFGWAAVVVAVALAGAHDQATTADAIAVLGAAQYNGRPSPVFRARLDHAAALYQRGLAPVVLVTGGGGTGDTVSESEVGRRYLTKAGLPENAVIALAAGASTASSVASVARWVAGRDSHPGRLPRERGPAPPPPARRHRALARPPRRGHPPPFSPSGSPASRPGAGWGSFGRPRGPGGKPGGSAPAASCWRRRASQRRGSSV